MNQELAFHSALPRATLLFYLACDIQPGLCSLSCSAYTSFLRHTLNIIIIAHYLTLETLHMPKSCIKESCLTLLTWPFPAGCCHPHPRPRRQRPRRCALPLGPQQGSPGAPAAQLAGVWRASLHACVQGGVLTCCRVVLTNILHGSSAYACAKRFNGRKIYQKAVITTA